MSHSSLHTFARLFVIAVVTVTFAACSDQSPVSPGGATASGSLDAKPSSGGVPGVYALTFWARVGGAYQEVSTLPVLSEVLILKAQVTDLSGNPATAGTVTFEYCSYGGRPNDITNADEAPKEACEQGQAKWARFQSLTVDGVGCRSLGGGSACSNFGIVRIPRTIGFRFRYAQQQGAIASGTSPARNFVWVAGS
jgi:hypothetical protein